MHSLVIINHFINEKFQAEEVKGKMLSGVDSDLVMVWCDGMMVDGVEW